MSIKELVALFVAAIFALAGYLGKMNIDQIQDKIRNIEVSTITSNKVQWEKISSLEKDIAYLKGFREGYRCGVEKKPEHP